MGALVDFILMVRLSDLVDVVLLTVVIYWVLVLIRGTRTIPMLIGLSVLLGSTYVLVALLELDAMGWLVENFVSSAVIVLVVLFQADIRNALAQVGLTTMGRELTLAEQSGLLDDLAQAAFALAHRRSGALIVLEHDTGLRDYVQRGTAIDGVPSPELLLAIFQATSPLHDGAVIIDHEGRLAAAGSILPLTSHLAGRPHMGTRHRAALGLSEETDAMVIVVSEERGVVSLVQRGQIEENLDLPRLRQRMTENLRASKSKSDAVADSSSEVHGT